MKNTTTVNNIKTIDVNALDWFDKVNGNSYFAATVIINYQMKDEQRFVLPFQYGYGDHYKTQALIAMDKAGLTPDLKRYPNTGGTEGLWQYCERHGIILRTNKQENCKKRELKQVA